MSDGSRIEANQKIDGGPSVLYDAVALLVSEEGAEMLAKQAAARDFVADAFAHSKFIANSDSAKPLLSKIIAADKLDDSFIEIREGIEASKLVRRVENCGSGSVMSRVGRICGVPRAPQLQITLVHGIKRKRQ